MKNLFLPLFSSLVFASLAHATALNFNATGTSGSPASWTTSENWSPNGITGAGDTANFIQANSAVNYVDGTGATVGIINFGPTTANGYVLQATGSITLDNGLSNAQINQLTTDKANNVISAALQIGGNGNLDITNSKNASFTFGTIYGKVGGSSTVTVNNSGGGSIILGAFNDASGTSAMSVLLNAGSVGAITLNVSNTAYSGAVNVQNGLVILGSGAGLGGTGTATVNAGGAININGKTNVAKNFILNGSGSGTGASNSGAIATAAGSGTINGTVQLASDSTIAVSGASTTLNLLGALSGTGKLMLNGGGTLTLSGTASSYSGGTEVISGNLVAAKNNALGTGNVVVDSLATLTLTSIGTLNAIDNTAGLVFASDSIINLNFTGSDTIGWLEMSNNSQFALAGVSYTAADLNTLFGVTSFTGSGSLFVSSVPEPTSYALMIVAGAVIAMGARRRRVLSV